MAASAAAVIMAAPPLAWRVRKEAPVWAAAVDGSGDRVGDVVELEVEEDVEAAVAEVFDGGGCWRRSRAPC